MSSQILLKDVERLNHVRIAQRRFNGSTVAVLFCGRMRDW